MPGLGYRDPDKQASGDRAIADVARFLHTVAYLKPVQVLGRLRFEWYHPKPALDATPQRRAAAGARLRFPAHTPRMLGPETFRFLNETRELTLPQGWNDPEHPRLWEYNLHYFEDLVADGAAERADWHRALVDRWVVENPPFWGTGWESYPLSLRTVNWIKWALAGNAMEPAWLDSLALQAEYLARRVEWHLLGNHVLENARALIAAGLFFEGDTADRWLDKGLRILASQLPEQILADGGHFERSPMYHGLVLEGLLDLVQISEHYGLDGKRVGDWRARAGAMVAWLGTMTHPDGEISFFNDAAFDVALPPAVLADYARRLGVAIAERDNDESITFLEESGYVRAQRGPFVALLDVAPLGPDYQPGHAHADTLSFELSVAGRRVLVNSGTSVYGLGEERLRQRGTAAHNTVVVDGRDSSEVWSGFRVGRRARPRDISIRGSGRAWEVSASHAGYQRLAGGVTHRRTWTLTTSRLTIEDQLSGACGSAVAYFHFHPDMRVTLDGSRGEAACSGGRQVRFTIARGAGALTESSYHPQFGVSVAGQCLQVTLDDAACTVIFDV